MRVWAPLLACICHSTHVASPTGRVYMASVTGWAGHEDTPFVAVKQLHAGADIAAQREFGQVCTALPGVS